MPHYYIDAYDGDFLHRDDEGHDLHDDAAARVATLDALPDMARDKIPDGDHRILRSTARDTHGGIIYTATLTLEGRWGPASTSARP